MENTEGALNPIINQVAKQETGFSLEELARKTLVGTAKSTLAQKFSPNLSALILRRLELTGKINRVMVEEFFHDLNLRIDLEVCRNKNVHLLYTRGKYNLPDNIGKDGDYIPSTNPLHLGTIDLRPVKTAAVIILAKTCVADGIESQTANELLTTHKIKKEIPNHLFRRFLHRVEIGENLYAGIPGPYMREKLNLTDPNTLLCSTTSSKLPRLILLKIDKT